MLFFDAGRWPGWQSWQLTEVLCLVAFISMSAVCVSWHLTQSPELKEDFDCCWVSPAAHTGVTYKKAIIEEMSSRKTPVLFFIGPP
jgi:hypothetical protein